MKVYVNLKQIGKKKSIIDKKSYELADNIADVKSLIKEFVTICVTEFNDQKPVEYLLSSQIIDQSDVGKIGFGDKENKTLQDLQKAIDNAVQSYEDGIYRIFINDEEVGSLNDAIKLNFDDELTFIRLTMLAGRMW